MSPFAVAHFYEVPYLYGVLNRTARNPLGNRPSDLDLSREMQEYWIRFVNDLTPNGNDSGGSRDDHEHEWWHEAHKLEICPAVYWPSYAEGGENIVLKNHIHTEKDDYREESISFLNSLG
jgi:hypothetical protein